MEQVTGPVYLNVGRLLGAVGLGQFPQESKKGPLCDDAAPHGVFIGDEETGGRSVRVEDHVEDFRIGEGDHREVGLALDRVGLVLLAALAGELFPPNRPVLDWVFCPLV